VFSSPAARYRFDNLAAEVGCRIPNSRTEHRDTLAIHDAAYHPPISSDTRVIRADSSQLAAGAVSDSVAYLRVLPARRCGCLGVLQLPTGGSRSQTSTEAQAAVTHPTRKCGEFLYLKFYVHQSSFTMMPGSLCLIPFDVL
jgi:hypothetical protein